MQLVVFTNNVYEVKSLDSMLIVIFWRKKTLMVSVIGICFTDNRIYAVTKLATLLGSFYLVLDFF